MLSPNFDKGRFAPRPYRRSASVSVVGAKAIRPGTPNTPGAVGIYGKITANGANAANIPLDLRRYNDAGEITVASTTTDSSGNYLFANPPSLPAGYTYYVRYGPQ